MLKYALLGFLRYRPLTGYDLEQHIRHSTGHFWHARLSQIYMTLKELEGAGWIESEVEPQEKRPDRRVYALTDAGRSALAAWLAEPLDERSPIKDVVLLKLFFSGAAGRETLVAQLRRQLDLHRQQRAAYDLGTPPIATELLTTQPDLRADALMWSALHDFGTRYEDLYIAWLEDTLRRIESGWPATP